MNGQTICDLYETIISIFDNGYVNSTKKCWRTSKVRTFNETGRNGLTCIDCAFASQKKVAISISGHFDDLCLS